MQTASADDGRVVSYAEYGDPAGTPVVFLHGTPGSRVLGRLFDDAARRRDIRLLAPDRPGYGASSPWSARTLADTGAFVAPVLDDADVSRAGVVGFSGGGAHALALAATHADRVREVDVVSGAAPRSLQNTTPATQRLLGAFARRAPSLLGGLLRAQAWVGARAPPSAVVSQYTTGDSEVTDEAAELVRRGFVEAFERHRSGAVTELRLLAGEWDVPMADVDSPVRLWHGDRDANAPLRAARALAGRLPDGDLTVVEGADHLEALLRCRSRVLDRQAADGAS